MPSSFPRPQLLTLICGLTASLACGGPPAGEGDGDSETETETGTSTDGTEADDACAVGQAVFDESVVHELSMQLSESDWAAMIQEAADSPEYGGPEKTYFSADFQLDGVALDAQVGLRLKGHSSLLEADGLAFPFKVDFDRVDDSQTLDGLSKVNLHANIAGITAINEYLSYGAIRAHGVPTARLGFARVTVNGEPLGLYTLVEHMQGKFVRCHFDQPHGDYYKPEEPIGNLAWRGPELADYEPEIQFKWPDVSATEHGSLLNLLDVINHQDVGAFDSVLNVSEVLTYLAVNVGLGNYDYYASYGHNYYLYESDPGRFTMLPWDMNFSQGPMDSPCGLGRNSEQWPVSNKLLGEPTRVQEYLGILDGFLQGPASVESLNQRIDAVLPMLGDDVDLGEVDELRAVIDDRVEALSAGISEGIDICPENLGGLEDEACDICIEDSCATQLLICDEDPACICMGDCVYEGEEEAVCLDECGLAEVPQTFTDVLDCVLGECADACA